MIFYFFSYFTSTNHYYLQIQHATTNPGHDAGTNTDDGDNGDGTTVMGQRDDRTTGPGTRMACTSSEL
jgi:hypothetical protein